VKSINAPFREIILLTWICLLIPPAVWYADAYDYPSPDEKPYASENAPRVVPAPTEATGPGAVFDSILTALSQKADIQNDRIKTLWSGIPNIVPDLYNVFITL
jgi:hypothetical protein